MIIQSKMESKTFAARLDIDRFADDAFQTPKDGLVHRKGMGCNPMRVLLCNRRLGNIACYRALLDTCH